MYFMVSECLNMYCYQPIGPTGKQNLFRRVNGPSDQRAVGLMAIGPTGRRTHGNDSRVKGPSKHWAVGPMFVGPTGRRIIGNRTHGPPGQLIVRLKRRSHIFVCVCMHIILYV